jgi:hypothetical protein
VRTTHHAGKPFFHLDTSALPTRGATAKTVLP